MDLVERVNRGHGRQIAEVRDYKQLQYIEFSEIMTNL